MVDTCCRSCDGRGFRKTQDRENVFKTAETTCGPCGGSGRNPGPPKGDRKFFRRTPRSVDDDNDLNRAGDNFLARHGFGKGGGALMDLRDLKARRDGLREAFDLAGGRGVDLADEIDEVEVAEHPLTIKEAVETVLKIAERYIEEQGHPRDESIADTEALRIAYIDQAIKLVKEFGK